MIFTFGVGSVYPEPTPKHLFNKQDPNSKNPINKNPKF